MWLKVAFACWVTAAAADGITTYQTAAYYPIIRETNPTLSPLNAHPNWMLSAMGAEDAAGAWAISRWVTPKHRKVAMILFLVGAAGRTYLAVQNVRHMRQADALPKFIPR